MDKKHSRGFMKNVDFTPVCFQLSLQVTPFNLVKTKGEINKIL